MSKVQSENTDPSISIRPPTEDDAAGMWRLAENSGVLDRNSYYCYFLLCKFFSRTCAVAEYEGQIVGFATAFVPPESDHTLFLWQTAVAPVMKRKGIAFALTTDVLKRCPPQIDTLEATIYEDNLGSQSLFAAIARSLGTNVTRADDFITPEMFPFELKDHQPEILFRIGPVPDFPKRISAMTS